MYSREGPVTFARHNLKAQGITYVNEVIPYVHYSWVVHIYIYICCLYYDSMYRACNTCCHSMQRIACFPTGGRPHNMVPHGQVGLQQEAEIAHSGQGPYQGPQTLGSLVSRWIHSLRVAHHRKS